MLDPLLTTVWTNKVHVPVLVVAMATLVNQQACTLNMRKACLQVVD